MQMTDKELLHKFLTLGEDCEFSFIQRKVGAEPLELLRFSGTTITDLIAAFEDRFVAIGEPEFTTVRVDSNDIWGFNTRYKFGVHGFGSLEAAKQPGFLAKFVKKMGFLRGKFMEDLAEGQKFLVYKRRLPITYFQVHTLYTSVRKLGANPLLWVVKRDNEHPPGTVENLGGGFFKGYIDSFTPYGRAAFGSLDVWLEICRNAHDLLQSAPDSLQLPPPPPSPPNIPAAPVWVARATTSLKKSPLRAASLPPEQKVEVDPGDVVVAKAYEHEAGHLKLFGVSLNGEPLNEPWFAYPDHWQEAPDIDSRTIGSSEVIMANCSVPDISRTYA
jgi:hypothetical protein